MAERIAVAVEALQAQRTGHKPKSVSLVLDGETLVVTFRGALSQAEHALAQSSQGAAKVGEFRRQLSVNAADEIRSGIARITGVEVQEQDVVIERTAGDVIQTLPGGTMFQIFLLSGKVPPSIDISCW